MVAGATFEQHVWARVVFPRVLMRWMVERNAFLVFLVSG